MKSGNVDKDKRCGYKKLRKDWFLHSVLELFAFNIWVISFILYNSPEKATIESPVLERKIMFAILLIYW